MNFEEWWEQFSAEHEEWRFADSEALRKAAYKAGAASRDAEVTSLTNQRDYEFVRAENALMERDQLRAEIEQKMSAGEFVLKEVDQLREQVATLREAFQTFIDEHEECSDADDWLAMMCSCEAYHVANEALAATEPKITKPT